MPATPAIRPEPDTIDAMHMVADSKPNIADTLNGELQQPPDEPPLFDEEQWAGIDHHPRSHTPVLEDVVVNVDRSGQSVALVLGSVEPVGWRVNTRHTQRKLKVIL